MARCGLAVGCCFGEGGDGGVACLGCSAGAMVCAGACPVWAPRLGSVASVGPHCMALPNVTGTAAYAGASTSLGGLLAAWVGAMASTFSDAAATSERSVGCCRSLRLRSIKAASASPTAPATASPIHSTLNAAGAAATALPPTACTLLDALNVGDADGLWDALGPALAELVGALVIVADAAGLAAAL